MAKTTSIKDLEIYRQQLLAESEAHRLAIRTQMASVEASLAWLERPIALVRTWYPIVALVIPLLSLARKRAPVERKSIGGKILFGWQLFRLLKPVWDQFRKQSLRQSYAPE